MNSLRKDLKGGSAGLMIIINDYHDVYVRKIKRNKVTKLGYLRVVSQKTFDVTSDPLNILTKAHI